MRPTTAPQLTTPCSVRTFVTVAFARHKSRQRVEYMRLTKSGCGTGDGATSSIRICAFQRLRIDHETI
jgi:hypothetical protein